MLGLLKARRPQRSQLLALAIVAGGVVVMTYRPGTVKRDLLVDLPRLRDPAAASFNALKRELGQLVMEEQQRHHHDELRMAAVE